MSVIVTNKTFIRRSIDKHGNKFDYSKVKYITQKEPVIIICPIHGDFLMEPRNHLRSNSGCQKCKSNIKKTNEQFIKEANLIHNNFYDYSNIEYNGKFTKLKIICPIHGDFEQEARFHLEGCGCQKCGWGRIGIAQSDTKEIFIEKAKLIHGDKYDYSLVNYKNSIDKVKIICPMHGIFEQSPRNHLNGSSCKKCSESKGERKIREYLEENIIKYIPQHKFKECRYKNELVFDFYLPEYNICIEYNGAQHYRPVKYWGGEETLEKIKTRDKIKKEYCKNNGIKLIIIRYNEDILTKLKKVG